MTCLRQECSIEVSHYQHVCVNTFFKRNRNRYIYLTWWKQNSLCSHQYYPDVCIWWPYPSSFIYLWLVFILFFYYVVYLLSDVCQNFLIALVQTLQLCIGRTSKLLGSKLQSLTLITQPPRLNTMPSMRSGSKYPQTVMGFLTLQEQFWNTQFEISLLIFLSHNYWVQSNLPFLLLKLRLVLFAVTLNY